MSAFNDAFSVPLHPSSPQSISFIGLLFPGLNTTLVAFQQLLAGDLNSYTGLLGLCGLITFAASLGTYPCYLEGDIPYYRGYLLYGPPGTGKTSAVLALASHFGLDVYKLNLASSVDDGQLSKLFDDLPGRCIVLLEDVDANKAAQRRLPDSDDHGGFSRGGVKAGGAGGSLTLTGLLNAIDGVSSVEGQLLIITTNHPEKLDEALIRPGRIDRRVEFGYATKDVIFQLFCNFFINLSTDNHGESPIEYNSSVEQLGIQLLSKVPGEEFTPAEVQSLFLENMQSPKAAIESVDQWMVRVRRERKA